MIDDRVFYQPEDVDFSVGKDCKSCWPTHLTYSWQKRVLECPLGMPYCAGSLAGTFLAKIRYITGETRNESAVHLRGRVRSDVDQVGAVCSAGGSLLLRRQKNRRKKLIIISIIFLLHLPLLLSVIIMVIITIANISFGTVIYTTINIIIVSVIIYIIAIIIIIISNISIDIVSNESFFNFLIIFSLSLYFDNGYHYYCWYQP